MNFQTPAREVMKEARKTLFPLSLSSSPRTPELSKALHFRQRETRATSSAFSRPSLAACAGESSRECTRTTCRYLMCSFIIFEIFSLPSCRDHPDKTSKLSKCEAGSLGEEAHAHLHGWPRPWLQGTAPWTRPRGRAMPSELHFFIPGHVKQWVLSLFKDIIKHGSMYH